MYYQQTKPKDRYGVRSEGGEVGGNYPTVTQFLPATLL